jgi:hypothetical protein
MLDFLIHQEQTLGIDIIFYKTHMKGIKKKSPKKTKTTVYMSEEEEILLNELFIKRLRERRKTDKSALFCEGIKLLFEKEMGKK